MNATIARQIADSGMTRTYAPWWVLTEVVGRGEFRVRHWDAEVRERDINEATGCGIVESSVTSAQLRAARERAEAERATCCDRGWYCAEDADQILQRAIYGRLVYA